jgi:hypothetical protein
LRQRDACGTGAACLLKAMKQQTDISGNLRETVE